MAEGQGYRDKRKKRRKREAPEAREHVGPRAASPAAEREGGDGERHLRKPGFTGASRIGRPLGRSARSIIICVVVPVINVAGGAAAGGCGARRSIAMATTSSIPVTTSGSPSGSAKGPRRIAIGGAGDQEQQSSGPAQPQALIRRGGQAGQVAQQEDRQAEDRQRPVELRRS